MNINHVLVERLADLQGMADKKCERLGMGMGEIGCCENRVLICDSLAPGVYFGV